MTAFIQNTDDSEAITLEGVDSTVFVTREGSFERTDLKVVDEAEIFKGMENKITLIQTYSKKFHCTYLLHNFPFDIQVLEEFSEDLFLRRDL